jgi:3-deoxy-D-manno-octulosonic-acid transferase
MDSILLRPSMLLSLYLFLTGWFAPLANRKLLSRLKQGKEDANRLDERRGIPSVNRPDGELIWFHAASVGESLSLLEVIDSLLEERPLTNILITTGTKTSADLISARISTRIIHQYIPIDVKPFVKTFLNHWKPNIAIFTESELWPCLIATTYSLKSPLILLNAKMSKKSFSRWKWIKSLISGLLRCFDTILAQDIQTANYLSKLSNSNTNIIVTGSLKENAKPLTHDEQSRITFTKKIGVRPIWLAASTHEKEEKIVAQAHAIARRFSRRLLLIIAPRHPSRGPQICEELRTLGWNVSLRSSGDEIDGLTEIYIADTLGEMGLWYRISPISFLGGSLVPIGGHNPYEPAALGSAIIHGPHITKTIEAYSAFQTSKASLEIQNSEQLSQAIIELLNPDKAALMAQAAWEVCSKKGEALSTSLNQIHRILDIRSADL